MEREEYFRSEETKRVEALKRKSACIETMEDVQIKEDENQMKASQSSDGAGEVDKKTASKGPQPPEEVSLEDRLAAWDRKKEEYEEHLRMCEDSPEIWDMQMTWEEWLSREKVDEDEFGPDEDIYSIRRACLDLPYHDREIERE